ncbi:MAG: FHA domain-containing protein [Planctomycetes bacterium]|nr:FHA domain-containing protein [Planctomycetota bacterium]
MTERTRIIGRSQSADLVIASSRVSRRHCSLISSGDGFVLQDHDSRNGVWFDGRRVKSVFLRPGDRFTVAQYRIRIAQDGSLILEGEVDPKKMLLRDKMSVSTPAMLTLLVTIGLVVAVIVFQQPKPDGDAVSSNSPTLEEIIPWTPKPQANQDEEDPEDPVPDEEAITQNEGEPAVVSSTPRSWTTTSGREWTLDELLTLAEAIEATGQGEPAISGTDDEETIVPALDPAEIVIPPTPNPWAEVARLRREGKVRRRRARIPASEFSGGDTTTTEVVVELSVSELLEKGRAALFSYHVPAEVMPDLTSALHSLRDLRSDEAWGALETLRRESRDLLRHVASRARQIGQKYGHLDRNPDVPLAPHERREAELALNLLVLIQEQMEVLLDARDAAFEVLANPADPEMLSFALSKALEDDDDELLDAVLAHGIAQKPPELYPVLIKGLKVPSATRKLKVRDALQQISGESFRSVSEWERWLNTREGSS